MRALITLLYHRLRLALSWRGAPLLHLYWYFQLATGSFAARAVDREVVYRARDRVPLCRPLAGSASAG